MGTEKVRTAHPVLPMGLFFYNKPDERIVFKKQKNETVIRRKQSGFNRIVGCDLNRVLNRWNSMLIIFA